MKLRLKTLANKPRSVAWPASARAVRCQVKSCNERDLRLQLLRRKKFRRHSVETACVSRRKEEATLEPKVRIIKLPLQKELQGPFEAVCKDTVDVFNFVSDL